MKSGEGVRLGNITIPALFFADDVVLVASSAAGLSRLMKISEEETGKMKLTISESKSKVVSRGDQRWEPHDKDGEVLLSIEKVFGVQVLGDRHSHQYQEDDNGKTEENCDCS